jgi:hypothetical protein
VPRAHLSQLDASSCLTVTCNSHRAESRSPGEHLLHGLPRSVPRSLGRCLPCCIPRRNQRSAKDLDLRCDRRSTPRNASSCARSSSPRFLLRNDLRSDPVCLRRYDLRSLDRSEAGNDPCRVPRTNPRCLWCSAPRSASRPASVTATRRFIRKLDPHARLIRRELGGVPSSSTRLRRRTLEASRGACREAPIKVRHRACLKACCRASAGAYCTA